MKLSRSANHEERATPKSEAKGRLAVGCSAWLGAMASFRAGWDHYLCIVLLLCSIWLCVRSLWEEYAPDFNSKKGDSNDEQSPREIDNAARRNLSKLRSGDEYLRMQSSGPDIRARVGRRKLSHRLGRIINPILKSFRFGHRAEAPNEIWAEFFRNILRIYSV
jgi:hypothetical protein